MAALCLRRTASRNNQASGPCDAKRFDAVVQRAHARSMNLQSQLVPAAYGDIGALFVAAWELFARDSKTCSVRQSRQLFEVLQTCRSNGRHSRLARSVGSLRHSD